jgi:hypothetical protein
MGLREEGPAQGKEKRQAGLPGLDCFSNFLSFFFFKLKLKPIEFK